MRTTLRLGVAIAVLALSTLLGASIAQAAPPANDNFADRVSLTSGAMVSGSNVEATIESGESFFAYGLNHSVWYEYTPASNGVLALTSCSSFPVNLIGMTGELGTLSAASFSPVSYTQSAVSGSCGLGNLATVNVFPVTNGVPIKIHVGSAFAANTGSFELTATFTAVPANDDFANAVSLSDGVEVSGSNLYATTEPNEEEVFYSARRSVWYTYTPSSKGVLSVTVCSAFPAHVVSWTGSAVDALTIAGYSPQSYGASVGAACESGTRELTSIVDFPVAAGVPLRIQVMGKGTNDMGDFDITADFKPLPANDDFADAITLVSGATATGSNQYATVEPSETEVVYTARRSVWYTYTPPTSGELELELCSAFPAHLVAWIGSSVSALSMHSYSPPSYVASTASSCASGTREFSYMAPQPVIGGVPIRVQVMGKAPDDMGEFSIRSELHTTPANDAFASATDLGSDVTETQTDDNFATAANEVNEPQIASASRPGSVWYKWTSPTNGAVNFSTCSAATTMNGSIGVFSSAVVSPTLAQLTPVTNGAATGGCSGGAASMAQVTPDVEAGKTYWIAVANDSASNFHGRFTLTINTAPDNTVPPVITGANEFVGTELSVSDGTWVGSSPISFEYEWLRCDANESNCTPIAGESGNTYTLVGADDGSTIRARVTASNGVAETSEFSAFTGVIDVDTDGDTYGDDVDQCDDDDNESPKTNGCPVEDVQVTSAPTISGTAQVGSALSLSLGSAVNSPGIDPSVTAPTAGSIYWYSCSSATDLINCLVRPETSASYTPVVADIGRFIRAEVEWSNNEGSVDSTPSVATALVVAAPVVQPPATGGSPPPAPTDPLTLTVKKSLGTVKRDKKGVFTLKGAVITCGAAATGPCTGTIAISAKVGKKTVKYGVGKTGQASGKSTAATFKPSAKLAKAIKKAKGKKLKVTLVFSVNAPGFPAQKATATATLR